MANFENWETPFLTEEQRQTIRDFAIKKLSRYDDATLLYTDTWEDLDGFADLHFQTEDDEADENYDKVKVYAYGIEYDDEGFIHTNINQEEYIGVFDKASGTITK